jgi:AcrR family transcriptional regulator
MPQVLKDEVRERICAAALEVFAERGYTGATMTTIAERAGVATANLYRYYPGKGELFDAVVSPEIAQRFETVLDRRVKALAGRVMDDAPSGDELGDEMLQFWIEHRLAVVILLDRAADTPYASYGERFVDRLVTLTAAQIRAAHPEVRIGGAAKLVLTTVFENTRRSLATILASTESERAIRQAVQGFWSYQLPGLRGLVQWIATRSQR